MDVAASAAVARAEWQRVVFAAEPRRLELLALRAAWPTTPLHITIHRNTGVELVTPLVDRFLAYAGYAATFEIGPYDDSLGFSLDTDVSAVQLVWLDAGRYSLPRDHLVVWLADRLRYLTARRTNPIVVLLLAPDDPSGGLEAALVGSLSDLPNLVVCNVAALGEALGRPLYDERVSRVTASPLSNRGSIACARQLGFVWLPPILAPRIKAIAVDLDETLFRGVLAEDGPQGVMVEDGHARIQRELVALHASGVLLVLVSKNERKDVEEFFSERADLPLKLSDFSVSALGWDEKAQSIREAAERLRIDPDSFLFVDDNVGEIAAAAQRVPGLSTLLAETPEETALALGCYPRLVGYPHTREDALRAQDLAAADRRSKLIAARDQPGYLLALGATLGFCMDDRSQVSRLHDLSMKTNQFNTSLSRMSVAEVATRMDRPDCAVVAVSLRDRLSDSGVIGAIQMRLSGQELVVDEVAISCRALGRGLEGLIISTAVCRAGVRLGAQRARFAATEGPRNEPARAWLAEIAADLEPDGCIGLAALQSRWKSIASDVTVVWDA
jgi:FkbH-like protein